jgi:rhodanese-related sulfurtransferase
MQIKSLDAKNLKSLLEKDEAVLIDVRERMENRAVRIKEATLIPLADINISDLPDLSDKKLVMQCKSGKRSFAAGQKLLAQNPGLEIYNLEGGIESWIANGFEVETN